MISHYTTVCGHAAPSSELCSSALSPFHALCPSGPASACHPHWDLWRDTTWEVCAGGCWLSHSTASVSPLQDKCFIQGYSARKKWVHNKMDENKKQRSNRKTSTFMQISFFPYILHPFIFKIHFYKRLLISLQISRGSHEPKSKMCLITLLNW